MVFDAEFGIRTRGLTRVHRCAHTRAHTHTHTQTHRHTDTHKKGKLIRIRILTQYTNPYTVYQSEALVASLEVKTKIRLAEQLC